MTHFTKIGLLHLLWLFLSFQSLAASRDIPLKKSHFSLAGNAYEPDAEMHINAPTTYPITGSISVCEGDVTIYTCSLGPKGYSYIWNVTGGTGTATANSFTVSWGNSGSGTVTLTVKNAQGGWVDSRSKSVTIHSKPNPFITASFSPTCKVKIGRDPKKEDSLDCFVACDSSVVVYTTPLNPGSTYTWTVLGAISFTPSGNTVSVHWGAKGSGLIRVQETNSFGCSNIYESCVGIIESPRAYFTSVSPAANGVIRICNGQTVQFYDGSAGSLLSPLMDWFWEFGDGTTSTDRNPSHAFTTGTYDVILHVKNECNCEDSYTVTVDVSSLPPPNIECLSTVCAGAIDYYSTEDLCPGATYNWSVSGGVITSSLPYGPRIAVRWGLSGPGIISLQELDCEQTCPTKANVVISIISATTPIRGRTPVCLSSIETYSIIDMPGCEFIWTVHNGSIIRGQGTTQIDVEWDSTGTSGSISLTYENPTIHCGGSASLNVPFRKPYAISGPTDVCLNTIGKFTATTATSGNTWKITNAANAVLGTSTGNIWNLNFTSPTFAAGTYKITLTNSLSTYCNSPQYYFVTVHERPAPPTFIKGTSPVCPGSMQTYTSAPNAPASFILWDLTNGAPVLDSGAGGNDFTVTWDPSGPYILSASQVMMAYPFCASAPFIDTIDSKLPVPPIVITGEDTLCKNSIRNYVTPYAQGEDYIWSISPATSGSIIDGQNSRVAKVQWNDNTGLVTLNLDVTTCGVTTSSTINILLTPPPVPIITGPDSLCANASGIFTTSTPATGYNWSFDDSIPPFNRYDTLVITSGGFTSPGIHYATLLTTNPGGCIGTSITTVPVYVNPRPDEAFISTSDTTEYCPNDSVNTDMNVSSPLYPGDSVSWYIGFRDASGMVFISHWVGSGTSYTATEEGSYLAMITNSLGCSRYSTNWIDVIQFSNCGPSSPGGPGCVTLPHVLSFSTEKTGCLTYEFTGIISSNGRPLGWTIYDMWGTTSEYSPTAATHTFNFPGNYRIRYFGRFPKADLSSDSCDVDTMITIVVPIKANFDYSIKCGGTGNYLVDFSNQSTHAPSRSIVSWAWTFPGGTPGSSTLQTPPSISFPGGATPVVSLMIISNTGDSCIMAIPLTIPDSIYATIDVIDSTCVGNAVLFDYTPSSTDITNHSWSFGDLSSSLLSPSTRTYTTNGSYTINLILTNSMGCTRQFTKPVFVYPNSIVPAITAAGPLQFCSGQSTTLNTTISGTGVISPYTYLWSTIETTSSIQATATGKYWTEVTDQRGCQKRSNTLDVFVFPLPKAIIIGDDDYCEGDDIILSAYQGPNYTYEWLLDESPVGSGRVYKDVHEAGTYNFQVILTDANGGGCSDTSDVFQVIVNPAPATPEMGSSPDPACEGTATTISAFSPVSPYTFSWNTGAISDAITVYNAGVYTVTLTDEHGCESENSVKIYDKPDFSNLLQGCYEGCETDPLTILGPVPVGTEYTYQWYKGGTPIPGETNKDLIVPGAGNGIYSLQITTGEPAFCTDISGPIAITYVSCKDCDGEWSFRDIECMLDSNKTRVFFFRVNMFNQFATNVPYSIFTQGGSVTGLSPLTLAPGNNLVTGYFVDPLPNTNPFCITGIIHEDDKRKCILPSICIDAHHCDRADSCDADGKLLTVVCAGTDANGKPQYYFDYGINWGGSNNAQILSIISADGTTSNLSLTNLMHGDNILSGLILNARRGRFCFDIYIYDREKGKICVINQCIELPECRDTERCRQHIATKNIECGDLDMNHNRTYKIIFELANPFLSPVDIYITSADGGITDLSYLSFFPAIYVQCTFTDFAPANPAPCFTIIFVEKETGKICKRTLCRELPDCDKQQSSFTGTGEKNVVVSGSSIQLNPNPAKEQTVISYTFTTGSNRIINVTDMYGRTIKTFNVTDDKGTITLQTGAYSSGVYMVTGFSDNKLVESKRLVITK
jgi:PKD repeat protein